MKWLVFALAAAGAFAGYEHRAGRPGGPAIHRPSGPTNGIPPAEVGDNDPADASYWNAIDNAH